MPLFLALFAVFAGAAFVALRYMERANETREIPQAPEAPQPSPLPFPATIDPEQTQPQPLPDPYSQANVIDAPYVPLPIAPPPPVIVQPNIRTLYQIIGARRGVDPDLLRAICIVESGENPNAENPADPSVGLGQVLCKFDPRDPERRCLNAFNIEGWRGITWNALKDPETNLDMAAQILAWNIKQFGFPRGIAVYNSWSARNDAPEGPYRNQEYVSKVLRTLANLKG